MSRGEPPGSSGYAWWVLRAASTSLWAETPAEEKSNFERFLKVAATNPSLPVITWNGNGADMPQLRSAAKRLNLAQKLQFIESRHLDLLLHAKNAFRLPIPQMGLSEVATHFAITRRSRIRNGFEALTLYDEYQGIRDQTRREQIRANLIEYNRDDVEALIEVAARISGLS
jgi:predicted RecB family nuclease